MLHAADEGHSEADKEWLLEHKLWEPQPGESVCSVAGCNLEYVLVKLMPPGPLGLGCSLNRVSHAWSPGGRGIAPNKTPQRARIA